MPQLAESILPYRPRSIRKRLEQNLRERSTDARARELPLRSPAPGSVRVVWCRGRKSLRRLPPVADPDPATALLAMWKSGLLARRSLPRVHRAAPCVRLGSGGRRLRGPVARLVGAWKEGGRRGLARLAADLVTECVPPPRAQAVTYVPAVGERALWRGFNPAAALAHELSLRWQLPVLDLLARRHSGRRQRELPLAERRRNVAGAFRPRRPSPLAVVLVDDVYTSGATVGAAARALVGAGAREVEVVTFARTLRGHR